MSSSSDLYIEHDREFSINNGFTTGVLFENDTHIHNNAVAHAHLDHTALVYLELADHAVNRGWLFYFILVRGGLSICVTSSASGWFRVLSKGDFFGRVFTCPGFGLALALDISALWRMTGLEDREGFWELEEV